MHYSTRINITNSSLSRIRGKPSRRQQAKSRDALVLAGNDQIVHLRHPRIHGAGGKRGEGQIFAILTIAAGITRISPDRSLDQRLDRSLDRSRGGRRSARVVRGGEGRIEGSV